MTGATRFATSGFHGRGRPRHTSRHSTERNMYLAVILGLCAFAPAFTGEAAGLRAQVLPLLQESPPQQDVPPPESSQKPPEEKPPTAATPQEPSQQPKATIATKKHRRRKHTTASDPNAAPQKKVVRKGGTGHPVV